MKNYLLILALLICSCAGKHGETTVKVYAINYKNCPIEFGTIWIYYNTKKVKKKVNDDAYITDGYATFTGLSKGNYVVRLEPKSYRDEATVQFRITGTDRVIYLREGQSLKQ